MATTTTSSRSTSGPTSLPADAFTRMNEGEHDQAFKAAGVLIFWRQNVLLCLELRHPWNKPKEPKQPTWSTFGGKREDENEIAYATMRRELEEESGLTSDQIDAKIVIEEQYWNQAGRYVLYIARIDSDEDAEALVATLSAKLPPMVQDNPSPRNEIERIRWHSLEEFYALQAPLLFGLLAQLPRDVVQRVTNPVHWNILVEDYIPCWQRIQLATLDGEEYWKTVAGPANASIRAGSCFTAAQVDIYPGTVVIRGEPQRLEPGVPPAPQFLRGYAALCIDPDGNVLMVKNYVQYPRLAFMIAYMLRDISAHKRKEEEARCRGLLPEEILGHAWMLRNGQPLALANRREIADSHYLNSIGKPPLFTHLWKRAANFLPGAHRWYDQEALISEWQAQPVFRQLREKIQSGGQPGPSHWNLPKGAKEHMETGLEAALRELKEETDLVPDSPSPAASIRLRCTQPDFGDRLGLEVFVFSVTKEQANSAKAKGREISNFRWMRLDDALANLATHYDPVDVDQLREMYAQARR